MFFGDFFHGGGFQHFHKKKEKENAQKNNQSATQSLDAKTKKV